MGTDKGYGMTDVEIARICHRCLRVGTRGFIPYGDTDKWVCQAVKGCDKGYWEDDGHWQ